MNVQVIKWYVPAQGLPGGGYPAVTPEEAAVGTEVALRNWSPVNVWQSITGYLVAGWFAFLGAIEVIKEHGQIDIDGPLVMTRHHAQYVALAISGTMAWSFPQLNEGQETDINFYADVGATPPDDITDTEGGIGAALLSLLVVDKLEQEFQIKIKRRVGKGQVVSLRQISAPDFPV